MMGLGYFVLGLLLVVGLVATWAADLWPEDKILGRFVSDDAKLVLSAMKKLAESPGGIFTQDRRLDPVVDSFVGPFLRYAGYIDRNVVKHARRRLERERAHNDRVAEVRKIAGTILMEEQK